MSVDAAMWSLARWPVEAIWQAVVQDVPGLTVEVLSQVDSSNSELMRRARAGQCEPTLLIAQTQTAGRGRRGKTWHSPVAEPDSPEQAAPSLTFSLGLPMAPADWSGLSLAVGVAVVESLQAAMAVHVPQACAAGERLRLGIKWPNDVWVDGRRKLGGILVETAPMPSAARDDPSSERWPPRSTMPAALHPDAAWDARRDTRYVVVGVGINIAPCAAPGIATPAACVQELWPQGSAGEVLLHLVPALVAVLQAFERSGFAPLHQRFAACDVLQNQTVQLSSGEAGVALGVNDRGALQVLTPEGLRWVTGDEVSVRPA